MLQVEVVLVCFDGVVIKDIGCSETVQKIYKTHIVKKIYLRAL